MPYRKKLIEVALPLEAINLESAREKSIRHGHPSTLHLWWARRPLAACRAVLWASLVDDPSSWPDKFPTEVDQQRERQRLFNILGRIEVQRDKKGNEKQVVRGLVSWDDVNNPNSGVLEAAQREIARCLAWERGEEPPTEPKAVREYIAKYAPPVYDPFAGGGSIPLEAQRLGLEAHASDLNPVAVLINKALIEIPPKFKDQPPVNPVSRGQGIGNRGQEDERGSVAPGSGRLAEVDGSSGASLSTERSLSQGRDVSPNQSDHTSSNLDSGEHSRGERTGNAQGLRQFSGDRQGIAHGNRNVPNVGSPSGLSNSAGSGTNFSPNRRNQQNANLPSQTPPSITSSVPSSLFPIPYKGAQGLAADVRYYGQWMREEAFKRIGHLYPKVKVVRQADGSYQPWRSSHGLTGSPASGEMTSWATASGSSATPHPLSSSPTRGEGVYEEWERWEIPAALSKKMTEVARKLRRQATPSEEILWQALRGAQLKGRKFRRQQPIGSFVVDFFCAAERLIVEVDGSIHDSAEQQELDRQRQRLLESLGFRFVRLSAKAVETELETCLQTIESHFLASTPPPLSPGGRGAGGEGATPEELTVIAWLWARTVKCPNPACGCQMPLVRSFQLSTKKGKEAWVEPVIGHPHPPTPASGALGSTPSPLSPRGRGAVTIQFVVKSGQGKAPEGTVGRKGARCVACGTPVPLEYIRQEGQAGRMGAQLMAIVAEGQNGRVYLAPTPEQEAIANSAQPTWKPDTDLPKEALGFRVQNYGMTKHADLFTPRQLVALTTFSDLVSEAKELAIQDAIAAGLPDDDVPLDEGGTGARAYGEAIATYLAFGVSRVANTLCTIARWTASRDQTVTAFARQAIPMTWDYPDVNPFSGAAGDLQVSLSSICEVLERSQINSRGETSQHDATTPHPNDTTPKLISTDPPYYDNIGYADLSDFFYVWLRRSIGDIYPNIFSTLLVPKVQELVATPYRFGGDKQKAKEFFEEGLSRAFERLNKIARPDYPLTIYYAFKQTEEDPSPPDPLSHGGEEEDMDGAPVPLSGSGQGATDEGRASTGWETMLEGLMKTGFSIDGTWPMRSELSNRMVASGTNALASSIVLVCRPRPADAPKASRRQFLAELKRELPQALTTLQQGNIAPVDLAQASIGPGMAVFSRYAAVLENDGSPMSVRTALQLINRYLDEYLTEQEGEFDSETRWALTWFEQHQFEAGQYGEAETLSKARNTTIQRMVEAGILEAKGGKVRLLSREEIGQKIGKRGQGTGNSPVTYSLFPTPSSWFITQALCHALDYKGEMGAAELLAQLGDRGFVARDLAYRLYNICDKKGWTQEAIAYNSLVIAWPEISRLASEVTPNAPTQTNLF